MEPQQQLYLQTFCNINVPFEIYMQIEEQKVMAQLDSFKKLINNGVELIFTVDCGTLSFEAIDYAFK